VTKKTKEEVAELENQARELIRLAARLIRLVQGGGDRMPTYFRDILRRNVLAARHFHAMIPLAVDGPMTVNDLAGKLVLAPASTSQLVSELVEAGLITRETDPDDHRRARVSLRQHLVSKVAAVAKARLQPFRAALIQIPVCERNTFIEGWKILIASMEAEPSGSSDPIKRKDKQ
jgi:DNA-binding MarR family transcriptional regulator